MALVVILLISGTYVRAQSSENFEITIEGLDPNRLESEGAIVIGSSIGFSERLVYDSLKATNPWMERVKKLNDSNQTFEKFQNNQIKFIAILGGPEQSEVAKKITSSNKPSKQDEKYGFVIQEYRFENEQVALIISSKKGFIKEEFTQRSTQYSPLNGIIPKEYIPAAATLISILTLALINIIRTVFEFKALDLGRKNKKVGEGSKFINGINISEIIAILGASIILGISISWQYLANTDAFWSWLLLNTLVCLIGAIIHEVTHRIFAKLFEIKMEYKFWAEGSLLTLISSYLGNAFSVQAFILEEIPEGVAKWKVGIMKLSAPLVSTFIMVIFAYLYTQNYDPIFKVIYSTSALWAIAEILPFSSLDGKDIKEWNPTVWGVAFLFISSAYFVVTFLI